MIGKIAGRNLASNFAIKCWWPAALRTTPSRNTFSTAHPVSRIFPATAEFACNQFSRVPN